MNKATQVLLVEDNEMNRDMLVRRLSRAGLDIITADNGQQALDKMSSEQPDLVLMDINLPVMDGWTACRTAQQDPEIADIPIIALTAHAMDTHREAAFEAGCSDYATKPIDFPALLEKIDRLRPQ